MPEDGVYVFFRYTDDNAVMIILNNNDNKDKELNTERFSEILKDYTSGKEIISQNTIQNLTTINVPAKSALIIELK